MGASVSGDWLEERTALQAIYEQDVAFPSASCTVLRVIADGVLDEVSPKGFVASRVLASSQQYTQLCPGPAFRSVLCSSRWSCA